MDNTDLILLASAGLPAADLLELQTFMHLPDEEKWPFAERRFARQAGVNPDDPAAMDAWRERMRQKAERTRRGLERLLEPELLAVLRKGTRP